MSKFIKTFTNYCCLTAAVVLGIIGVLTQNVISFKMLLSSAIILGLIFLHNFDKQKLEVKL